MCPIPFNIYRLELNKGSFSSRTATTHFLDKPYQKINFKSYLTSVILCKKKSTVRFALVPCDFISLYLFALTFAIKLKSANHKSHWNTLVFYNQWKMTSNLNMSHGNMSDFLSFTWFGFTLVIKLRNFDFKGH